MYAEPGFMYPFLPSYNNAEFSYDTHQMGNYAQNSTFDYDLGAEGDLFKAPEPIVIEDEPLVTLDPLSAALTIISNGQDVMTDTFEVSDMIESLQNEQLNDVFNECRKELLAKYTINDGLNETAPNANEVPIQGCFISSAGHLQKSVSSGCLNSMDWVSDGYSLGHNFLDFPSADFETAFGLRRTCSEGDIQSLGNKGFASSMPTSFVRQLTISELKSEQRMQKLSRYRDKKNKRNFGRKIKYACRKALADSQPRVKGRFAKTEDGEVSKQVK